MTKSHFRALLILREYGPQFNGDLGVMCGIACHSNVFVQLRRFGMIVGHLVYDLTDKGREALANANPAILAKAKADPKPRRKRHR